MHGNEFTNILLLVTFKFNFFFFLRLLIKLEACEQHGLTQVIRGDSNVLKLGLGEGRTSSPGHNQPA